MSEARPKIIIIAGPNGAGKSTLAPLLLRDKFDLADYVNADTLALGLSAFHPEKVAIQAGRVMLKRLRELAGQRESFAFESTLASRSYAPWISELQSQGYTFHLLFLWVRSPDISVERVKERVRLGGHDVPAETIRRRYHRGVRNFLELYQELANTWVVYDNSFTGKPILIAEGVGGIIKQLRQKDLWLRFCEARNDHTN
jgi:predicted ABC-type ATPase